MKISTSTMCYPEPPIGSDFLNTSVASVPSPLVPAEDVNIRYKNRPQIYNYIFKKRLNNFTVVFSKRYSNRSKQCIWWGLFSAVD